MRPTWEDLNARVHGLAGRFLDRAELQRLAQCSDLQSLAQKLDALGYAWTGGAGPDFEASPVALDLAVRRVAASRLRVLSRWSGRRAESLSALFEDEDRRSLRAVFRGAVAGVAPEKRLASTLPTPSLPERALVELARQPAASAVATLLLAWGSPYGSATWAEAQRPQPDLFALELALNRTFAERAARTARRAGADLVRYVRETIDLENVWSALALTGPQDRAQVSACFLDGGALLSREAFVSAAESEDSEAAGAVLAAPFAGSPFARILRPPLRDRVALEDAALRVQILEARRAARRRPLGVATVLAYWLRLRAEVRDLRNLIWGITLDAPRAELAEALVGVT